MKKVSRSILLINQLYQYVDQVSTGYELLIQGNDELVPTKVINISNFHMQGNHSSKTSLLDTLGFSKSKANVNQNQIHL